MSLTKRQRKVWVVITAISTVALLAMSFAPFFAR
ncbi:MAG: hypothetical protein UX37_C0008G0036 [Microgenomates group bacterium GW2011_GWA2_46_16]|nr:MAG: hypothetical protein UX37_C0008G0036 [Microgenomates group bacterium GW2011_GWA2_46_16]